MTRLVVTEDADADIEEVLAYLEREAGPRVAEDYGRKFGACLARLVEFPGIGTRRPTLGADTRIGIVRPYILIYDYVSAADTLTLLRICSRQAQHHPPLDQPTLARCPHLRWKGPSSLGRYASDTRGPFICRRP